MSIRTLRGAKLLMQQTWMRQHTKKADKGKTVLTLYPLSKSVSRPPCYGEYLLRLAYLLCSDINRLKTLVALFNIKGNIIAFSQ